jgi:uncharacterized protein YabE (DUF348 family)
MPVRPSRVRRLWARKAMANVTLAASALFVVGGYFAVQKTVTLVIEGEPTPVRTMSSSVGELLESHDIVVGERGLVVPPEATPLADGMTVVVDHRYFAPVPTGVQPSIPSGSTAAPTGVGAWVMEGVDGSATLLAARATEDWFSAGEPVGRPDVTAAVVVVLGKDHDVLTNAATVGELLSAMGIEPDRNDRVLPSPRAPLHHDDVVRVVSIEYRTRVVDVPIPFTTHTTYTDDLRPGQKRVTEQGRNGVMEETYRVKIVDGEIASRHLLDRSVVQTAVAEEREVGRRDLDTERTSTDGGTQVGEASWYSFAPGDGLTAAHPWLAYGTVVTVTNVANGRTVQVVINDRGPFGGRIIDLSDEAFARIAPLTQGVARVRLTW